MKRHFLIIISLIGIITGCKLDDGGFTKNSLNNSTTNAPSSLLIGKWFARAVIATDPVTGIGIEKDSTSQDYYKFNTDNTVEISSPPDSTYIGHYTYVNPKLTMGDANGSSIWTVLKLTTDSLVISTTDTLYVTIGNTTKTTTFKATTKFAHK
jgi:hypothetical protein